MFLNLNLNGLLAIRQMDSTSPNVGKKLKGKKVTGKKSQFWVNMLAVVITLILVCHSEGAEITTAYSVSGDPFSCLLESSSATDITLTCKISIAFSGSVVWKRDATEMAVCSTAVSNCVNATGFSEVRYDFTSDLNKKEFYFAISSVSSTVDFATFECEHGNGDTANFTVRECNECTVPSVPNGQTNATTTVVEGTVVVATCDVDSNSSMHTCLADQTWDNSFPNCEPPCDDIVCWIIVIVYVGVSITILVIYFLIKHKFELWDMIFNLAIILPAVVLTIIAIIVTVVVSRVVEKDCSVGACLVGPLIVSIIESWVHVVVIVIHIKCKSCWCCACCGPWDGNTDNSCKCFGGKITPICAGTDNGPPPGPGGGHGGQVSTKGQTRQTSDGGRQRPEGDNGQHLGKGRPLPLPGGGGDDGLQKSNEGPFRPRKLPDIPPTGDKNVRGISANFDEVVPDKKRLTPLGKEAFEVNEEDSPRKKKKKKKNKEKDASEEYMD